MSIGTSLHALTDFANDVMPFHDGLAAIAELGYETVMLLDRPGKPTMMRGDRPACSLLDIASSDRAAVREAVEAAGLKVVAVHWGRMRLGSADEVAACAEGLGQALSWCAELGCRIVIPNAGAAPEPGLSTDDKADLIARLAAVLMGALAEAPDDLCLAVDLHYHSPLETVSDCERLFDLAPNPRAGLTLNIGHLTTNRQEGWRLITEHPERVHVVAWKDHQLQPPADAPHPVVYSTELGQGDSPFARYVHALCESRLEPEHLITFEHVPQTGKRAALGRSLAYWRRLWERPER